MVLIVKPFTHFTEGAYSVRLIGTFSVDMREYELRIPFSGVTSYAGQNLEEGEP